LPRFCLDLQESTLRQTDEQKAYFLKSSLNKKTNYNYLQLLLIN